MGRRPFTSLRKEKETMRYRVNPETQVIHDSKSDCDDARIEGLRQVGFREFKMLMHEGFSPCDHCFRDDVIHEEKG